MRSFRPKAFTPKSLIHNHLRKMGEEVKAKNGKLLCAHFARAKSPHLHSEHRALHLLAARTRRHEIRPPLGAPPLCPLCPIFSTKITGKLVRPRIIRIFAVRILKCRPMKRNSFSLSYSLLGVLFLLSCLPSLADKKRSADAPTSPSIQDSQLYFSNRVFAAPGRLFMQRIKTIPADAPIEATDLPTGLTWNADLRRIEGRVSTPGTYSYNINLILTDRVDSARVPCPVTLTVDERYLNSRPVMGPLARSFAQCRRHAPRRSGQVPQWPEIRCGLCAQQRIEIWHLLRRSRQNLRRRVRLIRIRENRCRPICALGRRFAEI